MARTVKKGKKLTGKRQVQTLKLAQPAKRKPPRRPKLSQRKLDQACAAHRKWLETREGKPPADLENKDAQGLDLSEADLRDAQLQKAILSGANLQEANLSRANLQEARLSFANLQEAYLFEVTFRQLATLRAFALSRLGLFRGLNLALAS